MIPYYLLFVFSFQASSTNSPTNIFNVVDNITALISLIVISYLLAIKFLSRFESILESLKALYLLYI